MNLRLFTVGLRYLAHHRLQTLLLLVGIALGVAVVVAVDLANDSVRRSFRLTVSSLGGRATHQVVSGGGVIDDDIYRRLRVDLGVSSCAPVLEDYVTAVSLDGRMMRLMGVDPFSEGAFRGYLQNARGEQAASAGDLAAFLTKPSTVLLSADVARQFGLGVGATVDIVRGGRPLRLTVAGLLQPIDEKAAKALHGLLLTDIATAQEVFGQPHSVGHIDLVIDAAHPEQLARIEAALPPGLRVRAVRERGAALEKLTESFELNLFAVSLLALMVGVFLVYNTVTFFVVQRRGMFATLRALGVTRDQLFTSVVMETLLLGGFATVVGLGLGVLLGRGAVRLVTQTINDLYFVLTVTDTSVSPWTLFKGLVVGLCAALVSSIAPAWEAASVPPLGGLRRSVLEARVERAVPWVGGAGLALLGAGAALLRMPSRRVDIAFVALLLQFVGAALMVPLATVGLMRAVGPLAGRFGGVPGRLAPRSVVRSLSRTAVAIAALMVAVSIIVGLDVMVGSFRQTVEEWLGITLQADVYVTTRAGSSSQFDTLDPALAREMGGLQGVDHVETARLTRLDTPYGEIFVYAIDGDVVAHRRFVWADGGADDVRRAMKGGSVIVSEPFAYRNGVARVPGQTVVLPTEQGPRAFPVAGIYYDYGTERGSISIDAAVYRHGWRDAQVTSIALYVKPGIDPEALANSLRARYEGRAALEIVSNRTLRTTALVIFDRTFAITNALRLLVAFVAFIGMLGTLMALQLERGREIGVLRACGMTVGQLARAILIETGLMGLTAGLLALPVGTLLAWALVTVVNPRSFGWTMAFAPQPIHYATALATAVGAGLAAGLYPAWRFARIAPAAALRAE